MDDTVSKIDKESTPYCELCSACGETGCCPISKCLAKLVKVSPHTYIGEMYVKEALMNVEFVDWVLEKIDSQDVISAKEINTKYGELLVSLLI